jgi:hypothetical protein
LIEPEDFQQNGNIRLADDEDTGPDIDSGGGFFHAGFVDL